MKIYRELPKNFNEKDKDIFINLEKGVYIPDPEIVAYKNVLLSGFNLTFLLPILIYKVHKITESEIFKMLFRAENV